MSLLLAIDTSVGTSVALLRAGELLAQANIENNMKHAESIGSAIAQVLTEAKVSASDVNEVVVGRGPAPFTGLRVGIAAGVMFSEAAKARLTGVVSLDAIALAALEAGVLASAARPLLVSTDARRGEVYWALYSGLTKSGSPIRIQGPQVLKPAALADLLLAQGIEPLTTEEKVSAVNIGRVALQLRKDGLQDDSVEALYLRAPDAVEPKAPGVFGKKVSG